LSRDSPLTSEDVALGGTLLFDRRLSADDSQSCASCHHPCSAFSENRRLSRGVDGDIGPRNAMLLLNLAWRSSFSGMAERRRCASRFHSRSRTQLKCTNR
jgi:cytochrome c peroxidase